MAQFSGKIHRAILIFLFLLMNTISCKQDDVIPYIFVNVTLNPSNIIEFNIPGGSYYLKGVGYGGIIVVSNWADSSYPFLAFDAACTHEISSSVYVTVKDNGDAFATCPECGSQFMLIGSPGVPIKGPATKALKQYNATMANGLIVIHN